MADAINGLYYLLIYAWVSTDNLTLFVYYGMMLLFFCRHSAEGCCFVKPLSNRHSRQKQISKNESTKVKTTVKAIMLGFCRYTNI
ncbi:hypothetical protein A6J60_006500 [Psychrobacter sp. FDAARGOS_221]|nr:hypothetical protein A6J60_006500 [Psychrobacter sp. FDAARGOS_221]